jgi:hypothetical protein
VQPPPCAHSTKLEERKIIKLKSERRVRGIFGERKMQLKKTGENVNPRLFGTSGSLIGPCIINECFCSMERFFFFACQVSRLVQEADRLTPTHADPLSVAAEDRLDDDDTTNSRRTVHRTNQVSIFFFTFDKQKISATFR